MRALFFVFILIFNIHSTFAYEATNFTGSREEVRNLFSKLWSNFKELDNFHCYRRAHILSYQMSYMDINSMKVFFFKGDKLRMPMNWYYHVAPMVYYQGEGVVLDRALLEGATFLEDWLLAFSNNNKCREVTTMDEYRSHKKNEFCMYMIVPMYYYGPLDLEDFNMNAFDPDDLMDMIYAMPLNKRKLYQSLYPL